MAIIYLFSDVIFIIRNDTFVSILNKWINGKRKNKKIIIVMRKELYGQKKKKDISRIRCPSFIETISYP